MAHVSLSFLSPCRVQGKMLPLQGAAASWRCKYHPEGVPEMCPCVPRPFRKKLLPSAHNALPSFPSIPHLKAPSQDCGAQTRVLPLLPGSQALGQAELSPG